MGIEEKLPAGILLTTVEEIAGYARKSSVWPATFGLACCAIELSRPADRGTTWPGSAWNEHRRPRARRI